MRREKRCLEGRCLGRREADCACSAHCKWRFIWDADQSWDSFCVVGAVFGEVGVSLFVASAACGDILGDSRNAKCCIFQYKMRRFGDLTRPILETHFVWKNTTFRAPAISQNVTTCCGGCEMTISWSDHGRNLFESSFYWRKQFTVFPLKSWTYRFRGRRRQYLVRLEVDFARSAHSKWRVICDADQSWDAFCVAGAVFGEVGVWLFVAGAAFGDILGDSRSAKCCIFQYKIVFKVGRVRSPKRRVRDAIFWSDCRRIIVGLSSNRLSIGGSNSRSFRWSLELTDFVAGAIFGEVGGWLCMTFHTWHGLIMKFILRGRCSISWTCLLTFVAPRIVNDVSYVTRINHEIHVAWQVQYLVTLEGDCGCSAHCK